MTEAEAGLLALPTEDPTSSLIQLLDLGELEGARTDEDIFMGPSQQQPRQRVFGGQVLAQSKTNRAEEGTYCLDAVRAVSTFAFRTPGPASAGGGLHPRQRAFQAAVAKAGFSRRKGRRLI